MKHRTKRVVENWPAFLTAWSILGLVIPLSPVKIAFAEESYLEVARKHFDTLLAVGKDVYGEKETDILCGIIDTDTLNVPSWQDYKNGKNRDYPVRHRTCEHPIGGANLWFDMGTIRGLYALTQLTGDKKYKEAADAYIRDFIKYSAHPRSGLLGWGTHQYYDVFADKVTGVIPGGNHLGATHEVKMLNPIYDLMWDVDSQGTAKAIEGIYRCHITNYRTGWFTRHAKWAGENKWVRRTGDETSGPPFTTSSAHFIFAFSFIHSKLRENPKKYGQLTQFPKRRISSDGKNHL